MRQRLVRPKALLCLAILMTLAAGCSSDAASGSDATSGTAGSSSSAGSGAGGTSASSGGGQAGGLAQAGGAGSGGNPGSVTAGTGGSSTAGTSTGGSSSMGGTDAGGTNGGGTNGGSAAVGGGGAASADTWETYAKGFMAQYCVSCHNDDNAGTASRDYHMLDAVKGESKKVACGVAKSQAVWSARGCSGGPAARQFPAGNGAKPQDDERDRLLAWIDAGMP